MHIISSSEKYTLYPLHKNAHYILVTEMHIISASQINTINPSPQINTICPFHRYTLYLLPWYNNYILCTFIHYILYSDKRPIFSCQVTKLFPFLRYTNHILFSDKPTIFYTEMHIISSSRKTHYNLFSERHITSSSEIINISFSQKYTLYPLLRITYYILFSEIHIISSSRKYT